MPFGFLTNKEARDRIASLSQAISAKGGTPKQYPDFQTNKEAKSSIAALESQLAGLNNHASPECHAGAVDPDGQFPPDLQRRLEALQANSDRITAQLAKSKEASAKLHAKAAAMKSATASITAMQASKSWDLAARQAEGCRLLSLPRDSKEIADINAKAAEITPAGATMRQRLQDMAAAVPTTQAMNFGYRFKAGFDAARSYGPAKASALPAPAAHKSAMTAGQLLALPASAQAMMADEARRQDSGREARIELKRAHRDASPAQKLAMSAVFGKALAAHEDEAI